MNETPIEAMVIEGQTNDLPEWKQRQSLSWKSSKKAKICPAPLYDLVPKPPSKRDLHRANAKASRVS